MPDPTFQSVALSFAAAAKGLKSLKDLVNGDAKAQVSELYDLILSSQVSAMEASLKQSAMIEQIRELEKEIARVKAWETEKQRYKLIQVDVGAYAYSLKEGSKGTEPPHWICAKCYEDGRRSILQHNGVAFVRESRAKCPVCKSDIAENGRCKEIAYAQ